jgi:hypothetical protein
MNPFVFTEVSAKQIGCRNMKRNIHKNSKTRITKISTNFITKNNGISVMEKSLTH